MLFALSRICVDYDGGHGRLIVTVLGNCNAAISLDGFQTHGRVLRPFRMILHVKDNRGLSRGGKRTLVARVNGSLFGVPLLVLVEEVARAKAVATRTALVGQLVHVCPRVGVEAPLIVTPEGADQAVDRPVVGVGLVAVLVQRAPVEATYH